MNTTHQRIQQLEAENARLRAAMESVEWAGDVHGAFESFCPWCHGVEDMGGHTPACPRQIALGLQPVTGEPHA